MVRLFVLKPLEFTAPGPAPKEITPKAEIEYIREEKV